MPRKRFSAEQIVVLLRQIEVLMSQGKTPAVACREAGISQQSYYRWRKEHDGLEVVQAKRMKALERENVRLKRLVADLSLEKQILKGCSCGKLVSPERRRRAVQGIQEKLWSLRTPSLPDRWPATRNATIHDCRPS
jgi:putative transposase